MKNIKKQKYYDLDTMVAYFVKVFCENAAELGCPKETEVDMWFRYLSPEGQIKVGKKLLDIHERNRNDRLNQLKKDGGKK